MTKNGNVVVIPAYNEQKGIGWTLHALSRQTTQAEGVVVVDNGSTDDTAGIIEAMQTTRPNLHLIHETQKGTGRACNTGFRYAIDELGAAVVSRTDADSVPHSNWVENINKIFRENPDKQLLTGPSSPKEDDFYRPYDKIAWPIHQQIGRVCNVAITHSLFPLRKAHGHNMSIRAAAFDEVGGFPDTSILECDENVELSRKIYERYGLSGMDYSFSLIVDTSMRRVRTIGYLGFIFYRWNPSSAPSPERRLEMTKGNIDIR